MHTPRLVLLIGCIVALGACTPTVTTRGNLLSEAKLAQIQAQSSTKSDVERLWGPPTLVASFDESTWYYTGETTEQQGIYEPVVVKRQIVEVKFDANETVASVQKLDPKKGKDIELVERHTPTAGKEFTALQQAVGNLGKFNTDSKQKR